MKNITVLDSIMGSGKSTYVINYMNQTAEHDLWQQFDTNDHVSKKFIVVVPLLSEVDRFIAACPQLNFRDPQPIHGRKYFHLDTLIDEGANIVTTHALFKALNRQTHEKIKKQGYTLIIDEALDCVDLYTESNLSKLDIDMLFSAHMVVTNPTNKRLCWNHARYPNYPKVGGKFSQVRNLCDIGSLVRVNDKLLIWEFPSEFLACFEEVVICTYLFQGSPFYAYLLSEGFKVEMKSIKDGKLVDWSPEADAEHLRTVIKPLVTIYQGPMNEIGRERYGSNPLSSGWFKKASAEALKHLRSSTVSFFERHAKTPAKLNAFTCFSDHRTKISGKGYTKGWIPNNAKATNDYADKAAMAYLCNWFYHPLIKQHFLSKGVEVNEELYALSSMIQWIWRSRIRNGQPITLFIPSERMRLLFKDWLEGRLPLKQPAQLLAA